jgi:hypothetical protein
MIELLAASSEEKDQEDNGNVDGSSTLLDTAWGLSYITAIEDSTQSHIDECCKLGLPQVAVARLRQVLASNTDDGVTPLLRIVGNLITGSDSHTQEVLDAGLLEAAIILPLMDSTKRSVRKECFWIISNVLAGTKEQRLAVLRNDSFEVVPAIHHAVISDHADIAREASYCLYNAATIYDVPMELLKPEETLTTLNSVFGNYESMDDARTKMLMVKVTASLLTYKDLVNLRPNLMLSSLVKDEFLLEEANFEIDSVHGKRNEIISAIGPWKLPKDVLKVISAFLFVIQ